MHDRDKGALDVGVAPGIEINELLPDRFRRGLHFHLLRRARRSGRVSKHGNCRSPGHKLTQEFEPLRPQPPGEEAYARDVSADAVPHRAAAGREDDRHRHRRMPGYNRRNVVADDHRHRLVNQISHQSRQSIDVLSLDKAFFLQALAERDDKVLERRGRCAAEKADHGHHALLRPRRQRPRRRGAANQRDKLAAFQSI